MGILLYIFLDIVMLYKCKGDFYNAVPITRIEDNNIKLLWLTMVVLIIGLTMLLNSYIIPTELILRILHGIKSDIGGILSWIKKEPKRDALLKTIKTIETKVAIEGKSLSQEDFKRLEETQKQVEEIDTDQEEEMDMVQSFCFFFEGFCRHKCLVFNCFALLFFSIIISTILAMVLSAALLAQYGNIKKDICYPIQKINQGRFLSNGENISVIPEEKRLQIISQNDTHVSIVMPFSSEK
jgi:hypothetical protein